MEVQYENAKGFSAGTVSGRFFLRPFICAKGGFKAGRLEVSKAKNVGEKSLKIIDAWLKDRGFTWK